IRLRPLVTLSMAFLVMNRFPHFLGRFGEGGVFEPGFRLLCRGLQPPVGEFPFCGAQWIGGAVPITARLTLIRTAANLAALPA
ncbi:MAG: hypothetical protein V4710_03865, partial [Verrucomicrobiota bacterium]